MVDFDAPANHQGTAMDRRRRLLLIYTPPGLFNRFPNPSGSSIVQGIGLKFLSFFRGRG